MRHPHLRRQGPRRDPPLPTPQLPQQQTQITTVYQGPVLLEISRAGLQLPYLPLTKSSVKIQLPLLPLLVLKQSAQDLSRVLLPPVVMLTTLAGMVTAPLQV